MKYSSTFSLLESHLRTAWMLFFFNPEECLGTTEMSFPSTNTNINSHILSPPLSSLFPLPHHPPLASLLLSLKKCSSAQIWGNVITWHSRHSTSQTRRQKHGFFFQKFPYFSFRASHTSTHKLCI